GLCGSFNTNVIKAAGGFITENAARKVALGLVGRRGRDFFARRGFPVLYERINLFAALKFDDARAIAKAAIEAFTGGEVDAVHLVHNEFKWVMVQRVVVDQLLPIPREAFTAGGGGTAKPEAGALVDYLYEPAPEELFKTLLPTHVEVQIFRALLES